MACLFGCCCLLTLDCACLLSFFALPVIPQRLHYLFLFIRLYPSLTTGRDLHTYHSLLTTTTRSGGLRPSTT